MRFLLLFAMTCLSCDGGGSGGGGIHFHGDSEVLPGFESDTGLQPSGSDVQAQFIVRASGKVAVDGDADPGRDIAVGRVASGKLSIDGHFLLEGKLKLDISGLPKYDGPIPNLDKVDLTFGGEAAFDPFLLGSSAQVVSEMPETKLPDIPLPGGLTGKLVITIVKGSTVTSELRGICAGTADGKVQWRGATKTSGKLILRPTIVVKIPVKGDKSFDLPEIPVTIPARDVALDLGTHELGSGDAAAASAARTATPGGCGGGDVDGGANDASIADGSSADGSVGDDAPVATAKQVLCADAGCSVPADYCCIESDAGESCIDAGFPCGGNKVRCDQTADCESGVCCATPDAVSFTIELACQSSCTGTYARKACASDAECGAEKCIVETCRGRSVALCGGLPADVRPFCE
jgi:hypothetical protein